MELKRKFNKISLKSSQSDKSTPVVKYSYYHYGILLYFQGDLRKKDQEQIIHEISQAKILDLYRYQPPFSCTLCQQINDLYINILGQNQGIIYMAHENLEISEIVKFAKLVMVNEKVKKFQIFQGGPVYKKKITDINLEERLEKYKIRYSEFLILLDSEHFKEEILYEVIKDRYY